MKLGIVIVSYNSAKYLRSCLYALGKQTWSSFELLLVDNNSTDDSILIAKNFGAEVICNKANLGFAKSINQGTKALLKKECTHFLWLNPDAILTPNALENLIKGLHRHDCDIVQPVIYCSDQKTINTLGNELTYFGVSYCPDYGKTSAPATDQRIYFPSGACMLITRRLIESVHLLDEKFFLYLEDTDFGWRALMHGFESYLITDAKCYHDYELKLYGRKMYWLESNRLTMLTQNYSLKILILLLPIGLLLELALLTHSIFKGYPHWKILAYLRFLTQLPTILKTRQKIRKNIHLSDQDIFPHLSPKFQLKQLRIWPVRWIINPLLQNYYQLIQRVL